MMRHTRTVAFSLLGMLSSAASAVVGPELAIDVQTPIVHQQYFRGERELFGYNPKFSPNTVSFDNYNVPFIRSSLENGKDAINKTDGANGGVVQTLDASGNWLKLDFTDDIRAKYPTWNGVYSAGTFTEERVVFDEAGDAYMLVNHTRSSNLGRTLLLHSTDKARSWQVYQLPVTGFGHSATFEVPDNQSRMTGPPTIITAAYAGNQLQVIKPTKGANGVLTLGSAKSISSDAGQQIGAIQAGGGNATATVGNLTHVVYPSMTAVAGVEGTPQYAVTYNRTTGQVSSPVLLGVNGRGNPDGHNKPAIAVDSQGYIHAILGHHHGLFQYTRSLVPNSTTGGWTTPVDIGSSNNPLRGYTYVSMAIDKEDTIHIVGRFSDDNYRFDLDYLRKEADSDWENRGHLVRPFRSFYSTWDQQLTVDDLGRLFLRYSYYGDQFDFEGGPEVAAYRAKWPDEPISLIAGSRPNNGNWQGQKHHDPVILMSANQGDTWRIATTEDFIAGIVPEPGSFAMIGLCALTMTIRRSRRRVS